MSGLAVLALRDAGVDVHEGDALRCLWVDHRAYDDVAAIVRRHAIADVADTARCSPDDVTVLELTPRQVAELHTMHMLVDDWRPADSWLIIAHHPIPQRPPAPITHPKENQ